MFLKTAILVNWGNIPQLEFHFGPINLLSGGNGSGKTTVADAIQTLLTAAHETLFNYNPGQDEATQRSRGGKQVRTLASYVLGCDDGSYARPGACDGYIAGVFHPTEGEGGAPFTAVMGMRAHLDRAGARAEARLDDLVLAVIPGEQLSLADFVQNRADGPHVRELPGWADQLKARVGRDKVELYDKKGAYLRRLYGALRGQSAVSDREAKHAARTFANFMAYKPVKSISEFVAREILEPKDLGDAIRHVSELMKTIHAMEAETKRLAASADTLAGARAHARTYLTAFGEAASQRLAEALRQRYVAEAAAAANARRRQASARSLAELESRQQERAARLAQLHDEQVALEAERRGIKALADKDALERELAELKTALGSAARELLEAHRDLTRNTLAAGELSGLLQDPLVAAELAPPTGLNAALGAVEAGLELDLSALLSDDWISAAPLAQACERLAEWEQAHGRALELASGLVRDLAAARAGAARSAEHLTAETARLERDIARLQNHEVNYPPYVAEALAAIEAACPGAHPAVLCDFVEVVAPEWQMAIEGYIGGARFAILVPPEFEAEAIRAVRAMPGSRAKNARVVQGTKALKDAARMTLPAQSICEVMAFNHKIAEAYLKASYGQVLCVPDAETLRTTARGVTPEGLGSGNYALFRCDISDHELVFGRAARARALAAKREELSALQVRAHAGRELEARLGRAGELAASLRPPRAAALLRGHLDLRERLARAESLAREAGEGSACQEALRGYEAQMEAAERQLFKAVLDHNQSALAGDSLMYDLGTAEVFEAATAKRVRQLERQVDALYHRLKNNVLVESQDKLTTLKDSFNTAFVTHLCHAIHGAIQTGKAILQELNRELEHHRFGADRESYHFGWEWVPEYREYWQFFKEILAQPSLGEGASLFEASLTERAARVRDKLVSMLLDPDEQLAFRELTRLADYRNYRHYEIYKTPAGKAPIPLSQYGTGSGGQLETPAYIIRAAAVTSAFRFNEGNTHLRMVLVDEAFSKMDESRSREVIQYLTEQLGLQLTFIMPTSKSGPFMDVISNQFVFSKCPSSTPVGELNTRVLVDRKVLNQDRVKALWASHRRQIQNQGLLDFMEDFVNA